ncbi:MAG: PAS domain-containing protein [Gemmatimonadaceae bacterium]|nr:PAS domain-containing protein [Gemmatimonadaceae bacterium]
MRMTIRQLTKALFASLAFLALVSAVAVLFAVQRRRDLVALEERRFRSYQLAEELRRSSDELTWFSRAYVVTGDPRYERAFQRVLDVREGRAPRPTPYSQLFWSLVSDTASVREAVAPASLRDLMLQSGFTGAEMALLTRALGRSNALVAREEAAMRAMKGEFRDDTGALTVHGRPNQALAIQFLFDSTYVALKADIMAPIDRFAVLVEQRVQAELDAFLRQSQFVLTLLESVFALFVLASLLAYPVMRARVLQPVAALQKKTRMLAVDIGRLATVTTEIARGDLTQAYAVDTPPMRPVRDDEIGDLVQLHDSMLSQLATTGAAISTMTADLRSTMNALDVAHRDLQAILDSSPVAVVVSVAGVIRYCNPRFVELYDEGVGATPGRYYVNSSDRHEMLAEVASHGVVRDRHVKYRTHDGRVIDAITSLYALTFRGEPAVLGWIVDVSHLKEVEEALTQTVDQLQALEQLRDDLVHMLVHDMRSPLTALIGELQLMEMDATGELAEQARGAMSSVWRVNQMASTLLDVSRMEAGKMPITKTPTDLTQLAADARTALAAMEPGRVIEITSAGAVTADVDAGVIRRVVENLLSNAIKHTPRDGTIEISVSLADGRARVAVADQGAGVPPEARERIFQKYGGVAVRKDRQYHSVGLGLAFCKLAVEAHGGTIRVSDAPTRGSVFTFELPV